MLPLFPPKTFVLHLIRHGESTANVKQGGQIGGVDAQLTEHGRLQAADLGEYFRRTRQWLGQIHCSTLDRARETASIVCERARYKLDEVEYDERLVEINRGQFDGRPLSEVFVAEERQKMILYGMDYRTPGGETMHEVGARMLGWVVETCFDKTPGDQACIYTAFTHGHAIRCLLHKILGNDPYLTWRIRIDNTSITTLTHGENGWGIDRVNATPHLNPL